MNLIEIIYHYQQLFKSEGKDGAIKFVKENCKTDLCSLVFDCVDEFGDFVGMKKAEEPIYHQAVFDLKIRHYRREK